MILALIIITLLLVTLSIIFYGYDAVKQFLLDCKDNPAANRQKIQGFIQRLDHIPQRKSHLVMIIAILSFILLASIL